tara:strand:- start:3728 stop:4150 length:423 start_codon:yes stop_codon:yes gene_type:complete
MSDGSYQSVDMSQPVVDASPPKQTNNEKKLSKQTFEKPTADRFKMTSEWLMGVIRGTTVTGGVYVSSTINDGGGWRIVGSEEGSTYMPSFIVSIDDWNRCLQEVCVELAKSLHVEASAMRFADHDIEDDPVLGPLVALMA